MSDEFNLGYYIRLWHSKDYKLYVTINTYIIYYVPFLYIFVYICYAFFLQNEKKNNEDEHTHHKTIYRLYRYISW